MKYRLEWLRRWPGVMQWLPALIAALCAAWSAHRYLSAQTARIEAAVQGEHSEYLVADRVLPAGSVVTQSVLALRAVPVDWAGSHGLRAEDVDRVLGRTLAWGLQPGEPLREMHLAAPVPARLSERLAPGRRALTIQVSQASTQSGLLQPGDRIDLYVALPRQGRRATTALLQDVVVLATGATMDGAVDEVGERSFGAVTLDVSQEDALLLLAAREEGEMIAILRASGDDGAGLARRSLSVAQLLGEPETPPLAPPVVLYGNRGVTRVPPLDGKQVDEWEE